MDSESIYGIAGKSIVGKVDKLMVGKVGKLMVGKLSLLPKSTPPLMTPLFPKTNSIAQFPQKD